MKLLRFGELGSEKPGILDSEGQIRDLSSIIQDINPSTINDRTFNMLENQDLSALPVVSANTRIGACVGNVGKMICIGLNYSDHAAETGATPPPEPIIFMKVNSAICGPNDDVRIPKTSEKTDWEVELGIVIGDKAKCVPESKAMQHIAGYTIVNDVSERAYQLDAAAGQWTRGKGCDTFCPVGPWLVTKDEISRPQNLSIWLELNGKKMQNGNTKTMVFNIKELISYVSHYMTLYPGDIIATGTPPGVGMGMKPPRYLKKGDEMKLGIDGLGVQIQKVISWKK